MLMLVYNRLIFIPLYPFLSFQLSLDSSSAAPTPLLEVDSGNVAARKQKSLLKNCHVFK